LFVLAYIIQKIPYITIKTRLTNANKNVFSKCALYIIRLTTNFDQKFCNHMLCMEDWDKRNSQSPTLF